MPQENKFEQRFWPKVNKEGSVPSHMPHLGKCWEWIGGTIPNGSGRYGAFESPVGVLAHRYSWTLHKGQIPDGLKVLHHCDNKLCVNPSHLFIGTAKDNARDLISKGLKVTPKGEDVVGSKLTKEQVLEIYNYPSVYGGINLLSHKHGVSRSTIKNIRSGKAWAHATQTL